MPAKPKTVNVELTQEANAVADALADKFGMKKKVMVQRALLWLDAQPEVIQHAAFKQLVPGYEAETLRLVLKGMEGEPNGSPIKPVKSILPRGQALSTPTTPEKPPGQSRAHDEDRTSRGQAR